MATRLALVNARYELGQALGTSGEAQAYVARDTRTGVDVVLKVVSPGSEAARVRLVAEFERLAALGHAALPEVVGLGEVAPGGPLATGAVFLAIARLDGDDARRVCTDLRAAARARLVARIVFDAAGALSGLHDAGLVHHDVKPEHLIATSDGRFRLIDLGLVRPKGSASTEVHGTLSYLSPDALAGSTDPAVDLYALGATAYELLTGAPPYRATDPRGLLEAQAEPLPPPPGPPALAALVMALLALDPAMRPTHAARVRDELVRSGLVAGERLVDPPGRVRRSPSFVASPTGRGAALEALGHALAGASVVALVGPTGSGRSRLVAELERRDAIAALRAGRAPGRMFGPSLRDAARELGVLELVTTDAPLRARSAFLARVVDALEERQATLHLASHAGVPLLELAALFDPARGSRTARLVIELEDEAAGALCVATRAGLVARVDLPPLDRAEVEALCERVLGVRDEELARLAEQRSLGRPRALLDLLWAAERRASLRAARSGGGVATAITVTDLRGAELTALDEELATAVAALSKDALGLLAELALLGRPVTLTELARAPGARSALPRSIAELERAGCVSSTGSALVLGSRRVAEAVLARVPAPAALGERLIAQALRQGALLDAAAVATAIGAPDAQARTVAALRQLLDGPGAERAAELLLAPGESRARALAAGLPGAEGAALEGELLVEAAEYEAAISRLREAVDGLAGALTDRPRYVLARALRLAGRSDEALAAARALGAASPAGRALTARLLLDRGDAEGALLSLRPEDQAIDALEIRVVACTLRGQLDEARGALARLGERLAGESVLRRSRGEGLRGLVAQADCALESAALAYDRPPPRRGDG